MNKYEQSEVEIELHSKLFSDFIAGTRRKLTNTTYNHYVNNIISNITLTIFIFRKLLLQYVIAAANHIGCKCTLKYLKFQVKQLNKNLTDV